MACPFQTTLMACEYADGVVMGADSRSSVGPVVSNRLTDKLGKLTDRIFVCRSGSSADTQAIADVVYTQLSVQKYVR